jgi:hypothetical protein
MHSLVYEHYLRANAEERRRARVALKGRRLWRRPPPQQEPPRPPGRGGGFLGDCRPAGRWPSWGRLAGAASSRSARRAQRHHVARGGRIVQREQVSQRAGVAL